MVSVTAQRVKVVSQDEFPRSFFLQDIRPRNRPRGERSSNIQTLGAGTLVVQVAGEIEDFPKEK